jgi:RNA polymerase sigma-70 factor (ECF subfamily)
MTDRRVFRATEARSSPAETAEEREWIRRCRQGDEDAFRSLLHRYRGPATYLAAQILGDATEAEDVVQEAFLHVFRSLHRFRGDASFYSWLYRIVVNLCLSRMRRKSRRRCIPLEEISRDHEGAAPSWDTRLQVETLLASLSEEIRVTLLLREVAGLSYAEIAEELEIPVGTVRSRLNAGREQFRRRWEQAEQE